MRKGEKSKKEKISIKETKATREGRKEQIRYSPATGSIRKREKPIIILLRVLNPIKLVFDGYEINWLHRLHS